ncbi:MAG TPA: hypothetical protein VMZ91_11920 [Candidatus Paceibacterota bacterium]|nr:hypothetical protein [Candidatus Paceibacterota bacterium]
MSDTKQKKKCKLCFRKTKSTISINLEPVYICDNCCNAIARQQVNYLTGKENIKELYKNE